MYFEIISAKLLKYDFGNYFYEFLRFQCLNSMPFLSNDFFIIKYYITFKFMPDKLMIIIICMQIIIIIQIFIIFGKTIMILRINLIYFSK